MGLTEKRLESVLVLEVSGALNFVNAEAVKERIRDVMAEGIVRFVVDMQHVPLVDSTGIGVLVSMHNRLVDAGGAIRLAGVQDNVMRILKAAHLDNYMKMFGSADEAVGNFA